MNRSLDWVRVAMLAMRSAGSCGGVARCRPFARTWLACFIWLLIRAEAFSQLETVFTSGPAANRVNAFFLGDGYTAADLAAGVFSTHVQNYADYMFADSINSDPFYRYRNFFNLYRVNVVSAQSGADQPQNGIFRDTALDATYLADGVTERLLTINVAKADAALSNAIAGTGISVDLRFVAVNDALYGGAGGPYAVYSAGNGSAREIALHELAHSFSGLADEYGGPGTYAGGEPNRPNATLDPSGGKWAEWIGYADPAGGVVGAYEGGMQFDRGVYRPTPTSKMRSLGVPFNAVSRETLILDIYKNVTPLDGFSPPRMRYADPTLLFVERVDDSVIHTQWFVNNVHLPELDNLSSINPLELSLGPGQHSVRVRAFDPTGFDPAEGWVRRNTHLLEQSVAWSVQISVPEPAAALAACSACFALSVALARSRRKPRRLTTAYSAGNTST